MGGKALLIYCFQEFANIFIITASVYIYDITHVCSMALTNRYINTFVDDKRGGVTFVHLIIPSICGST